jgi:predicted alpha/beta-fold hydrolase
VHDKSSKTLWDFNGSLFETNTDEYLAKTSSHEIIENTKVPMFIINSMDDPFFSYNALDNIYNVIQKNSNVFLLSTSIGGHIGWCKDTNNVSWVFDDVLPLVVKMF